jgi:hypothetical protein
MNGALKSELHRDCSIPEVPLTENAERVDKDFRRFRHNCLGNCAKRLPLILRGGWQWFSAVIGRARLHLAVFGQVVVCNSFVSWGLGKKKLLTCLFSTKAESRKNAMCGQVVEKRTHSCYFPDPALRSLIRRVQPRRKTLGQPRFCWSRLDCAPENGNYVQRAAWLLQRQRRPEAWHGWLRRLMVKRSY